MARALPYLRNGERFPCLVVVIARRVSRIIPCAEPPGAAQPNDLVAGDDRGRHLVFVNLRADGAPPPCGEGDRQCLLEHRKTFGRQLGQVVRQHRHAARRGDDRCPHARLVERERWPGDEAVGVVEPDGTLVEAAQRRGARRLLDPSPTRAHILADAHTVHEAGGMLQRGPAAEQEGLGAQSIAQRG